MNRRQAVAYAAPCARAWETISPDFCEIRDWKGARWSTILTLNK